MFQYALIRYYVLTCLLFFHLSLIYSKPKSLFCSSSLHGEKISTNRGDGDDDEHHRATVDLSVAVRGQWVPVVMRQMSGEHVEW